MAETKRLLEAASALSELLRDRGIPHAFHGSMLTSLLANVPHTDVCVCPRLYPPFQSLHCVVMLQEILCIVEAGQAHQHPFRRVRDAISGHEDFKAAHSAWTDR
jgi:hypothetical protein